MIDVEAALVQLNEHERACCVCAPPIVCEERLWLQFMVEIAMRTRVARALALSQWAQWLREDYRIGGRYANDLLN